jgi:hypothetical protein
MGPPVAGGEGKEAEDKGSGEAKKREGLPERDEEEEGGKDTSEGSKEGGLTPL